MSDEVKPTIGAMRGTARLVFPIATEQPKPVLRLVKDDDEMDRPNRVEKENEHGR